MYHSESIVCRKKHRKARIEQLEILQLVAERLASLDAGQAQIAEVIPPTMKPEPRGLHSHEHSLAVAHIDLDEVVGSSHLRSQKRTHPYHLGHGLDGLEGREGFVRLLLHLSLHLHSHLLHSLVNNSFSRTATEHRN